MSFVALVAPSPGTFSLTAVRAMVVNGMALVHSAGLNDKPFVYYAGDGEGGSTLMFSGVVAYGAEHVAALSAGAIHCFGCGESGRWPEPPKSGQEVGAPKTPLFSIKTQQYALYLTTYLNKFAAQHVGCKKEETE